MKSNIWVQKTIFNTKNASFPHFNTLLYFCMFKTKTFHTWFFRWSKRLTWIWLHNSAFTLKGTHYENSTLLICVSGMSADPKTTPAVCCGSCRSETSGWSDWNELPHRSLVSMRWWPPPAPPLPTETVAAPSQHGGKAVRRGILLLWFWNSEKTPVSIRHLLCWLPD